MSRHGGGKELQRISDIPDAIPVDIFMNDYDRITQIQKATTNEQLDDAMRDYRQQAVTAHIKLQDNVDFNASMEAGEFLRALESVRHARLPDQDEYFDVIRVLEFAETRRLYIKMH